MDPPVPKDEGIRLLYIVIGCLFDVEPEARLKIHKKRHLGPDAGRLTTIEVISQAGIKVQVQAASDTELESNTGSSGELDTVHALMVVGI